MATRNHRRPRRRGRFGFLYKLLSFVLILAAIVAGCIVFFRVEEIIVAGSTVYSNEEIIAASGVEQGDNLFLVGVVQTGRKISEQLPYIDDINIRWNLPDALIITVTECNPVAVLKGDGGTWWVIDSAGKLLEQGGSELAVQYPQITGLTALMPQTGGALAVSMEESTKLSSLKKLLAALEERNMLGQVQTIDLSDSAEIHMGYDNRFRVLFPVYSEDYRSLVHTLQAAVERTLNSGQTGTIDLVVLPGERGRFIPD